MDCKICNEDTNNTKYDTNTIICILSYIWWLYLYKLILFYRVRKKTEIVFDKKMF